MDMQFAAEEISRVMSKPEEQVWRSAKKSARYWKDNKRMVVGYRFWKLPEKVVVSPDTDFAGCKRTRGSTSGGVVMFGSHCIKMHSQTQETIALSSGESELYGIVKAAAMGLGVKGLMEDLGLRWRCRSTRTRVRQEKVPGECGT
jgi:hypothetical protein